MASLSMGPDELAGAYGGTNGVESLCAGLGLKSGGYEIMGPSHMGKKNCNIAVSNIKMGANGNYWKNVFKFIER